MSGELVSLENVEALFARYTWNMPGWTMSLDVEPMMDAARVRLATRTRNTYEPDNPTPILIQHTFPVPMHAPIGWFGPWLRDCIHSALKHEADEWFREDGVMIHDPHAPKT